MYLALTVIMASFIIKYSVYYQKNVAQLNYTLWDISTVTAGDFTVQFNIPEKCYQNYMNTVYVKMNDQSENSRIKTFKEYLTEAIMEQLNRCERVLKKSVHDDELEDLQIAACFFGYANSKLITMLKKRGNFLTNGKIE